MVYLMTMIFTTAASYPVVNPSIEYDDLSIQFPSMYKLEIENKQL